MTFDDNTTCFNSKTFWKMWRHFLVFVGLIRWIFQKGERTSSTSEGLLLVQDTVKTTDPVAIDAFCTLHLLKDSEGSLQQQVLNRDPAFLGNFFLMIFLSREICFIHSGQCRARNPDDTLILKMFSVQSYFQQFNPLKFWSLELVIWYLSFHLWLTNSRWNRLWTTEKSCSFWIPLHSYCKFK